MSAGPESKRSRLRSGCRSGCRALALFIALAIFLLGFGVYSFVNGLIEDWELVDEQSVQE